MTHVRSHGMKMKLVSALTVVLVLVSVVQNSILNVIFYFENIKYYA